MRIKQGGMPFESFLSLAAERLAEAKRKYAALDGWVMQLDGEGVDDGGDGLGDEPAIDTPPDDDSDPVRLKETLAKERELRRKYEREARQKERALKSLQKSDPEEFNRLKQEFESAENQRSQLQKQLQEARARADRQAQELAAQNKQLQDRIADQQRRYELRDIFFSNGGLTDNNKNGLLGITPFEQFEAVIRPFIAPDPDAPEGETRFVVMERDGKTPKLNADGKPMSVQELVQQLRDDPSVSALFGVPERGGSGANPQMRRGNRGPVDRSKLTKYELWNMGDSWQ